MSFTHDDYLSLLQEEASTLEKLTELTRQKAVAVRQDDLVALNECMKHEQVYSLALRGFEQKRMAALPTLGLVGVPLSMLSAHYPLDSQMEAKVVSETLLRQYRLYTSASEVARSTLECNLHQIETFLSQTDGIPVSAFLSSEQDSVAPPAALRTNFRA